MAAHRFPFTALRNPALVFIVLLFVLLSAGSAIGESLTYDEIVHIEEGINAWRNHTFAVDVVNPPLIREIAVVPIIVGLAPLKAAYPALAYLPVRMMIVLSGVFLLLAVYTFTTRYFGERTGLLASLLLAFEPNILTHSHYVTLDFGFTAIFFILYSYFISMLILRKLHMTHFVALGILTGMTLASKVSALLMIPLSFLSTIVIVHRRQALTFLRSQKKGLAVSIVIGIFLLWGTYFFQTGFIIAPGGNENRISRQLYRQAQEDENRTLTRFITLAETVKVPLGTYISMVKNSFIYGRQQGGNIFFLGSFHDSNSPVYGFLTVFMKTPIPLLIFFMFGLSQIALKKLRRLVLLMLIPIAVVFLTSLTGSVQPLIRYLLPMYPFILIVAALGSYKLFTSSKYVVVLLVVWYVMGTVKEYPHFIRYTNELIPSAQRYRNLIDSNIDWGQGLVTLNKYVLGKQPEHVTLSYFGRDDAAAYGFPSTVPWGSYKFEEICSFHDITKRYGDSPPLTIVSVSNWYYCGYYRVEEFARERITGVVADTFLVFR